MLHRFPFPAGRSVSFGNIQSAPPNVATDTPAPTAAPNASAATTDTPVDTHKNPRKKYKKKKKEKTAARGSRLATRRIPQARAESQQIAAWQLLYRVQHPARYLSRLQTIPSPDIEI